VLANQQNAGAAERDCLRAKQAQFAVTDDRDALRAFDRDALHDAARCSEWLSENGVLINDVVRHRKKISHRQA
jgi:hypothetical protein